MVKTKAIWDRLKKWEEMEPLNINSLKKIVHKAEQRLVLDVRVNAFIVNRRGSFGSKFR
jgi:hypothetical protein